MNDYRQEDECPHGMPAPEQCFRCMEERRRRQRRQRVLDLIDPHRQGFIAGHPGFCPRCGDSIASGERITGTDAGYAHVRCEL